MMDNELSMIAKKVVLEGFLKNEDMLSQLSSLEVPLKDFIGSLFPSARDYEQRRDLIRIFNEIAKEIYGSHRECPVVQEFGSFLMDIFDPKSDLDLSINFSNKNAESQRDIKIKTLRQFGQKLRALQNTGHVKDVQSILSARVPVLKVTDCGSGIECDLSVGNRDGITKSHIIQMISDIDERFRKLSVLMKAWAKAQDINCSKEGTLNSLSLILLAAFHLQTRNPPIFPPFSSIFEGGTDPKAVEKIIPKFKNFGMKNKESVAELFVSLLIMLESVETLWPKGLCVSVYEGSWVYKQWKTKKGGEKMAEISIEDFPERSENTARVVTARKMRKINMCIRRSLQQIRSFVDGNLTTAELMNRLFGITSKKRKRKPKGKGKGKVSQKPHENHRLQQANRVVDMSHEITNGIQSSSAKQKLKEIGNNSEKRRKGYSLQSTSFQTGPPRVDMSHSFNGVIGSSNLSHYNHFNQGGPTIVEPHAMLFDQGSLERGIGRDTERPSGYYRHFPSISSPYQASMVGMSHEIIGGIDSYVPLERGIGRDLERPHEYYRRFPSTTSSHYQASTVGMSRDITEGIQSRSFTQGSLERGSEYYRRPPSTSSHYQASTHEIIGGVHSSSFKQGYSERGIGRDYERSSEYYRLPSFSSQYETQSSSVSHYNNHFNQVYPQHVPYPHEAQQVYHEYPRSQYRYPPPQSGPPYHHRNPSSRGSDAFVVQRAPRR